MKNVIALIGRTDEDQSNSYPWLKGELVLFLGEIDNMPGHGVYLRKDGKTYYGYHTDDFIEYNSDDNDLEDNIILKLDLLDRKKYFCLSEDYIQKLETKQEMPKNFKELLRDILNAPEMFARTPEGLEDLALTLVKSINPEFHDNRLPSVLANKFNIFSQPLAPKFNFESSPSLVEILEFIYENLEDNLQR